MPRMIRKQVYIEQSQDRTLKREARARGVTEAELIRQALDRGEHAAGAAFEPDPLAWKEFQALIRRVHRRTPKPRAAKRWTRDDLYADRVERRGRHAH